MQETWAVLHSGHQDAATNMAIDEMLLTWHSEGKIPPTIRFYGWERPSLTIGRFQDAEKSIHFAGVERHGCDFVRRLTGGSAVLHDDELTYSIIVREDHPLIPHSVNEAYYVLSQGLLAGYKRLGVAVDFAQPARELLKNRSAVCFERPAIYEMIADGKKISGNAQTRQQDVLLQHGSIPMSLDAEMLFDLFNFSSERLRKRQCAAFAGKATSLHEVSEKTYTYEALVDAFLQGFEECLGITTVACELDAAQLAYVDELVQTKYQTDTWNKQKIGGRK